MMFEFITRLNIPQRIYCHIIEPSTDDFFIFLRKLILKKELNYLIG